ncbi:MAG: hypothetical protein ACFCUL_03115 [Flavobacteriaceae bacterium]
MNYIKEYAHIGFRVAYSLQRNLPDTIAFAALPYEQFTRTELDDFPNTYLIYGKVAESGDLCIGFKGFSFLMTMDFHSRLGLLYEIILREHKSISGKK